MTTLAVRGVTGSRSGILSTWVLMISDRPTSGISSRRTRRRAVTLGSVEKVNVAQKLSLFGEQWSPKIVGELNGQHVKLVKFSGEFVWHHHDDEDEMFLVVNGRFRMEFRDREVWIEEGEFIVVPRGIEHRPVAEEEASVMLFEPASTLNTGNVTGEMTVAELD